MAGIEHNRFKQLTQFTETEKMEWRRRLLLFSVFFVIATLIWFLNALSKDFTTEIKYPITYSRFPENKLLTSDLPEDLQLKVTAHGYALLSYKLSNRPIPINFQVNSFALNSFLNDSSKFYLLTRYAKEQISRQLPPELQLLEASPDSLIFQFANEVTKKLRVETNLEYEVDKDFTEVDGIVVDPDSIWVSGPDIFLDTIETIYTESMKLGLLEKSYQATLELLPEKGMQYEFSKIDCSIALEKITEVQLTVPIQVANLPDSLRMQTFPQTIRITAKIGLSNFDRVVPEAFLLEVDYKEAMEGKSLLGVSLKESPEYLLNMDYYPKTVEYLLSVK